MAVNPRIPPLGLTRDQLATFLKDHEQIKQFENLFAVAASVAPDNVEAAAIAAGTAQATAIQALGQIAALAQEVAVCCSISDIKGTQALDQIAMLAQETAVSIASAENKANQAMALLSRLAEAVEGLQMLPPKREFKRSRYGSFYDTTTQTAAAVNTAKAITFNTTDLSHGVYLGTPTSRIYVDTEGIYNFQTSIQLDSTVATDEEFYLWFRLNGVDVTNSASQVRIKGNNAEVFLSLNYFFNLKAGDYVELIFSVTNLGVQLLASGPVAPHPGIPSIILTVANNIGGIQ
jgi:hypothetical protein